MTEWLAISPANRRQLLNEAAQLKNLPAEAIEKDWWVTLVLDAVFRTPWKDHLVFKGGTSLSKAWNLIQRFSEDIDLAIDRSVLGFPEAYQNPSKLKALRKAASLFLTTTFKDTLASTLYGMGVPAGAFTIAVEDTGQADRDPQVLELHYTSVVDTDEYILQKVVIEIGARSLKEPFRMRQIQTILSEVFATEVFAGAPFEVAVVDPKRTFLEKAFLLHEEFLKDADKMRHERLSRHLYDMEKLMDTEHGTEALRDPVFYAAIVQHRRDFNALRGISYDRHDPATLDFIPPEGILSKWRRDYHTMSQNMIYGYAIPFWLLLDRMHELRERFRLMAPPKQLKEQLIALKIDHVYLSKLIVDAKKLLMGDPLLDGMTFELPVTRPTDIFQPLGPSNRSRQFMLSFIVTGGRLVFVGIKENTLL